MTTPVPAVPAPLDSRKTNVLAIISLVVAIAPILLIFIPYIACLAFLCPLAAIILGIVALTQISKSGGLQKGKGLAIAGIIVGGLWVILIPAIVIGGLTILGPAITNIFNNIMNNLPTSGY
jgi:hypothetical protein